MASDMKKKMSDDPTRITREKVKRASTSRRRLENI
jgi:hypothetical protein